MKIIVKHPTNPLIILSVEIDNSTASTTTIRQVLKYIEEAFITGVDANRALDYAKYWRLRNIRTGETLDNNSVCSSIDPSNNEFSVIFTPS